MANGVINGEEYFLTVDGKYIIGGTTASINFTSGTKDISCRETNNWKTQSPSWREWTLECEGKMIFDFLSGTMLASQRNATFVLENAYFHQLSTYSRKIYIELMSYSTGLKCWYGEGYLTSASIDAPNEDNTSIKLSFKGISSPTMGTV